MPRSRIAPFLMVALLLLGACGSEPNEPEEPGSDPTPAAADCEEGIVETESGLKYEETKCGSGEEAGRGDTATIRYRGTLENGKEFDAGEFSFPIGGGRVIAGFDEGVTGMKVGGQRTVTIPPELGYGAQGSPPVIPPNATLIFEIELLEIAESAQ